MGRLFIVGTLAALCAVQLTAAEGFFRLAQDGSRWQAVDPEGRPFVLLGVDHVTPKGMFCEKLNHSPYERHVREAYPDRTAWADETVRRLKSWGFNALGSGCDVGLLGHRGLAHTLFLDMGQHFASGDSARWIREFRNAPCTAFPNVFDPEFATTCDRRAAETCAAAKDDSSLFGYFIDNELAWWGSGGNAEGMFDAVRELPSGHSARQALETFVAGRPVTPELKVAFLAQVAERYFAVTTAAIRRHDPNHLVLGCRFAGIDGAHDVVWQAAARHCDLVTFNCYPWADLDRNVVLDMKGGRPIAERFDELYAKVRKPLLVTEWSFPALDAGRPSLHGAGQRFRTQSGRVAASGLFAKTLLSLPYFIGYDYFMWVDEPALGMTTSFPEDSNYGLVREDGTPYAELTEMFARIQREALSWRAAPLPPERKVAAHRVPTEREKYVAAANGPADAVRFARDGSGWRLSNDCGVVLKGAVAGNGTDAVASVEMNGRSFGSLGVLLEADYGGSVWCDAREVRRVDFAREDVVGVVRITVAATAQGHPFEMTLACTVAPGRDDFVAEITRIANTGRETLPIKGLFLRPFAAGKGFRATPTVPNLWQGEATASWTFADGSRYAVSSGDPSVRLFLFSVDPQGVQHPDVVFNVEEPRLAPGAVLNLKAPPSARLEGRLAADWSGVLLTGETAEGKLFYAAGEPMTFRLRPSGKAPPGDWFVRWKRTGDDGKVEEGFVPLDGSGVAEVKTSLAKPGFVRLEAFLTDADGREIAATNTPRGVVFFDGGAGVEPEKLAPPPEPADFDAWWSALRERVAKTPPNPRLKEYPSGRADVKLFAFEIDSPAGPCTGWLATPTAAGRYPCRIRFFGYNESWSPRATAVRRPDELSASELRFWVSPHGFEQACDASYYAALRRKVGGKFGGHAWDPAQNASPDTSYFRKMAERVLSALAYAKARPEWDGRTLVVNGGSQGGLQSVWAAAQDPAVTSADVWIVWNCDAWGKAREGRLIGDWALPWAEGLRYFDAATHASRISPNCRVEVSYAGLGDYISPPSGIAAFYNALRGQKRITWLQGGEHSWRPHWTKQQKETWSDEAHAAAGWEPSVKRALDDLVERHRGDPTAYAVFDFDYTLAIGDSSYVCIWQILETGDFRGGDMVKLMSEGVPAELLPQVADLFAATDGVQRVKRFWPLYRRLWNDPGEAFGCEWRSRLFAGYTSDALVELARTAMRANAKRAGHRPDENVPTEKRGFVILPEVKKLVHDLRTAGIATYVVSGSCSGVLGVATGPEFGLDFPPECVFGCDTGVVAGKKADFIRRRLAPRHGGRDPVLVAGDSMGDYAMFTELPGVENALVFRRQNRRTVDAPLRKLIDGAPGPDGKYLVQGRDEPNGRMIPSHESVFK